MATRRAAFAAHSNARSALTPHEATLALTTRTAIRPSSVFICVKKHLAHQPGKLRPVPPSVFRLVAGQPDIGPPRRASLVHTALIARRMKSALARAPSIT